MREVARPRQVHRDAGSIRRVNRLLITHGPTGLHHGTHSRVNEDLQAVGEGEERVGGSDRPDRAALGRLGHHVGGARTPCGIL